MLMLACAPKGNLPQPEPADLIPAPVELTVRSGSVSSQKLTNLPQKVTISEKALLGRLNGRKLTDWQLKSAYWMEIGKRGVKIEAADKEGVFYARQSIRMMAALDSTMHAVPFWIGPDSSIVASCWTRAAITRARNSC